MENKEIITPDEISAKAKKGVGKLLTGMKEKFDKCPKVKIKIPANQLNPKDDEVVASINGYIFQMKRGVEIEVPVPVKKLLERCNII